MSAISTDVFRPDSSVVTSAKKNTKSRFLSAPVGRSGLITYYARSIKAMLAIFLLMIPVVGLPLLSEATGLTLEPSPIVTVFASVLMLIAIIAFILYCVRITIYRLHDLNLSAWFVLLFLIPLVGSIFAMYVGLVPGKQEENRFGSWQAPNKSDKVFGIIGVIFFSALLGFMVWGYLNAK